MSEYEGPSERTRAAFRKAGADRATESASPQPELPFHHRDDLGTERAAANTVRNQALLLRHAALAMLKREGHDGITAWEYMAGMKRDIVSLRDKPDSTFRARLTEMTTVQFGHAAFKTVHRRTNGRGNTEAVYVAFDQIRRCCYPGEPAGHTREDVGEW